MYFPDNKELSKLLKSIEKDNDKDNDKDLQNKLTELVSYASIDLETAGLDARNNQIIQIAIILSNKDNEIEETVSFKLKLDEKYEIWDKFAEKLHGISKKDIKTADGKNVFDMEKILSGKSLTKEELKINKIFEVLKIAKPSFRAWNVTFDYKFFEQFLYDHKLEFDDFFHYSPVDLKSYTQPLFDTKKIDLNILKVELPEIYKEGSFLLDKNGNVKINMNSFNQYFNGVGQFQVEGNIKDHDALEDIYMSVYNVDAAKLMYELGDRSKVINKLSEKDFYSKNFSGEKLNIIRDTITKKNEINQGILFGN